MAQVALPAGVCVWWGLLGRSSARQHLNDAGTWLPQAQMLSPSCRDAELRSPQYPTPTWLLMQAATRQTEDWIFPEMPAFYS